MPRMSAYKPRNSRTRLHKELTILFGLETFTEAHTIWHDAFPLLDSAQVKILSYSTDQLISFKDNPKDQISFIKEMEHKDALLLCIWLMDVNFMDRIV